MTSPQRRPDGRYRLTDAEKSTVLDELRTVLIAAARARELLTYTELALRLSSVAVHPHSFVFAHLLRECCRRAELAGEGLLCALVVSRLTGMPGAGYFRRPGLPPDLDTGDLEAVWRSELEAVYQRWADA